MKSDNVMILVLVLGVLMVGDAFLVHVKETRRMQEQNARYKEAIAAMNNVADATKEVARAAESYHIRNRLLLSPDPQANSHKR